MKVYLYLQLFYLLPLLVSSHAWSKPTSGAGRTVTRTSPRREQKNKPKKKQSATSKFPLSKKQVGIGMVIALPSSIVIGAFISHKRYQKKVAKRDQIIKEIQVAKNKFNSDEKFTANEIWNTFNLILKKKAALYPIASAKQKATKEVAQMNKDLLEKAYQKSGKKTGKVHELIQSYIQTIHTTPHDLQRTFGGVEDDKQHPLAFCFEQFVSLYNQKKKDKLEIELKAPTPELLALPWLQAKQEEKYSVNLKKILRFMLLDKNALLIYKASLKKKETSTEKTVMGVIEKALEVAKIEKIVNETDGTGKDKSSLQQSLSKKEREIATKNKSFLKEKVKKLIQTQIEALMGSGDTTDDSDGNTLVPLSSSGLVLGFFEDKIDYMTNEFCQGLLYMGIQIDIQEEFGSIDMNKPDSFANNPYVISLQAFILEGLPYFIYHSTNYFLGNNNLVKVLSTCISEAIQPLKKAMIENKELPWIDKNDDGNTINQGKLIRYIQLGKKMDSITAE